MNIEARVRWLTIGAEITIGFGLLIAVAAVPALNAPTEYLLDLIYFPVDGAQTMDDPAHRLFSAISGGILAGWGVMLFLVARKLYPQDPELGRSIIIASVATWFVIDSAGSVLAGAPLNALFNVGFLLIFVLPVWKRVAPDTGTAAQAPGGAATASD